MTFVTTLKRVAVALLASMAAGSGFADGEPDLDVALAWYRRAAE